MDEGGPGGGRAIRVLHAEDDASFRELVADLLDAVGGIEVVSTATPSAACSRLAEERFDCVLSDYDGGESAAFLPVIEATADGPPCILLTGMEREQVGAAAAAAVDDYVRKGASGQFATLVERIRNHADRHRSAERYRALFESGAGPMVVHDAETGAVVDVNPQYAELLGYDRERAASMDLSEMVPGEEPYTTERAMERLSAAAAGEERTFEWETVTADGERVPVEVTLKRMDVAGAGRVLATIREISDRKRREREIRDRSRRRESLAAAFPDRVFFLDADGIYQEVWLDSQHAARGEHPRQGPLGEAVGDRLNEAAASTITDAIDAALATGERQEVEYRIEERTPTTWFEAHIAPLPSEDGERSEVVLVARDITTQREYERRLEAQNERLDEFASMVSHDLRNPLNVVNGRIDLIETAADDEDVIEHAAAAGAAATRMNDLIEDMLTLARTDEQELTLDAVALSTAATRAWSAVSEPAASIDAAVDRAIRADESELIRLFENLFRNAVEHAGPDVSVRVEALSEGFAVVDDGPGIDEQHRDRVFESGYSTASDGTGFGLDIVERVAEAHGWTVSLTESEAGARFEVTGVQFVDDTAGESGEDVGADTDGAV